MRMRGGVRVGGRHVEGRGGKNRGEEGREEQEARPLRSTYFSSLQQRDKGKGNKGHSGNERREEREGSGRGKAQWNRLLLGCGKKDVRDLDVRPGRLFPRFPVLSIEERDLANADGSVATAEFRVVEGRAVVASRVVPDREVVDLPSVTDHGIYRGRRRQRVRKKR